MKLGQQIEKRNVNQVRDILREINKGIFQLFHHKIGIVETLENTVKFKLWI